MPVEGEYAPSPRKWVRDQVAEYEASGGTRANTLLDRGIPIVIVTTKGAKTGKVRKLGLMRVEHEGQYALVASMGGAPQNPVWYHNVKNDPAALMIQDGPQARDYTAREVDGEERALWWGRAVAVYPDYADYEAKTDRIIPVFVAAPASPA